MVGFKKIKSLILAILLFAAGFFTCFSIYSKFNNKELISSLSVRYPNGFITKTVKIDDSLIALSLDNAEPDYADCPTCYKPPVMYSLRDASNFYEVNFDLPCIFNERFDLLDVDGDGKNEIVSEWMGHACGAGGLRGLVVWKLDSQKKLIPLAGYPQDKNGESKFTVKNLRNSEVSTFPEISSDCFTDYQLSPSHLKLFLSCFVWDLDAGESRNSPHIWRLQVFKFENGAFVKDESWNNGEEYLTEKKIDQPWDDDFKKLKDIFNSLWGEEN